MTRGPPPQGGPQGTAGTHQPAAAAAAKGPPLQHEAAGKTEAGRGLLQGALPRPLGAPRPWGLCEAFKGLCAAVLITHEELQCLLDAICEGQLAALTAAAAAAAAARAAAAAAAPVRAVRGKGSCRRLFVGCAGGPELSPLERSVLFSCFGAACKLLGASPPRMEEGGLCALLRQAAAQGVCSWQEEEGARAPTPHPQQGPPPLGAPQQQIDRPSSRDNSSNIREERGSTSSSSRGSSSCCQQKPETWGPIAGHFPCGGAQCTGSRDNCGGGPPCRGPSPPEDGPPLSTAEEREALAALHLASSELHALFWRRLHTGHWEAVPLWCREAFAAACLLLSCCYGAAAAASVAAAAAAADTAAAVPTAAAHAADTTAADTTAADTAAKGAAAEGDGSQLVGEAAANEDFLDAAAEGIRLAFRYADLGKPLGFRALRAGLIMGGPKLRVYARLTAAAEALDSLRARLQQQQQQQQQEQQQQEQQQQQQQEPEQQEQQVDSSPISRRSSKSDLSEGGDNGPPGEARAPCGEAPSPLGLPEGPGQLVPVRRRRADVEERTSIGFEDFLLNFVHRQRPLLIRGGAAELPAVKLWADWGHLRRRLGHRLVPVEIGSSYSEEGWTQRLMLFEDFFLQFVAANWGPSGSPPKGPVGYLAQHGLLEQIPALAKEAPPPDLAVACAEGELTRLAWVGPGGTVSPLHTDSSHNLFVQIVGNKRMQLFPPTQTEALYPFQRGLLQNTSCLPSWLVEAWRLPAAVYAQQQQLFPLFFTETEGLDARLHAGDVLFIPRGWWHFVKADGPSVSVSNWFQV
ncbi:hypothetical protein Efla_007873 [Eimeria flavescens]